jgi:tRNA A-37 threonylcarbamoyl transferase component Bud32
MATRKEIRQRATDRAVREAQQRRERNIINAAAKNGADCPACRGTGVKQVQIGRARLSQPCFH